MARIQQYAPAIRTTAFKTPSKATLGPPGRRAPASLTPIQTAPKAPAIHASAGNLAQAKWDQQRSMQAGVPALQLGLVDPNSGLGIVNSAVNPAVVQPNPTLNATSQYAMPLPNVPQTGVR